MQFVPISLDRSARPDASISGGHRTPTTKEQQLFSQLMVKERSALLRFLMRQGANPALAEDCLQEALVRAYRSLHTLRDWNMARSWLFGISKNVYLNEIRRQKVRSRPLPEPSGEAEPPADEQLVQDERRKAVVEAIEKLKPPKPEIIDLHYRKGLTLEEIAKKLEVPIGTVKTNLFRARAALRRHLSGLEVLQNA